MIATTKEIQYSGTLPSHSAGMRFDQALCELLPEYSRTRIQSWIRNQQILANGKAIRAKDKVLGGEQIEVQASLAIQELWLPENIALDIVYEDESLMVVNKPPGLVVHPAAGNWEGTLVNALLHYQPALSKLPRAGIIHRLDKDTSGLLVIAKTLPAHTSLVQQLQARTLYREYEAIVNGVLISGGTVEAPIERHPIHRKRMAVIQTGKPAVTHYRIIERFEHYTHLKVILETGRTHQIRVHMAHIHHAIVGDLNYGGRLQIQKGSSADLTQAIRDLKRQALHAKKLGLLHPVTQKEMLWSAPAPVDILHLLKLLSQNKEMMP